MDCPYCKAAGRPLLEKPLEKPWFPRNVLDPVGKAMEKPIGKAMVPISLGREYFKEIIGIGTKKVGGLGLNMGRKWWIQAVNRSDLLVDRGRWATTRQRYAVVVDGKRW